MLLERIRDGETWELSGLEPGIVSLNRKNRKLEITASVSIGGKGMKLNVCQILDIIEEMSGTNEDWEKYKLEPLEQHCPQNNALYDSKELSYWKTPGPSRGS